MSARPDRAKVIEAAEQLAKAGRLEEAIDEYRKLLDGGPQDAAIRNVMGDLYVRLGQQAKALEIFKEAGAGFEKQGAYPQALAILKKAQKFDPQDSEIALRMADLYGQLGFAAEARTEYLKAAEGLEARSDAPALLLLYEKLTKLDRRDIESRLKLAQLCIKRGFVDRAVGELNDVSELLIVREELEQAERLLLEAWQLKDSDARTAENLVRVYAKAGRHREAITLVEQSLAKHSGRQDLFYLLGNLYLESGREREAHKIFSDILGEDPQNTEARVKLGYLEVRSGNADRAYEIFEPLVSSLISRGKQGKAIGLLGIIAMSGITHVPTLEKLAHIYRQGGQWENLEVVDRLLLDEFRRKKFEEKRALVLRELAGLSPQDKDIEKEFKSLDKKWRKLWEGESLPEMSFLTDEDRELIRTNLAKVDLYLQKGLIRNARRILENLQVLYPDESRIGERLAGLKDFPSVVGEEEIPELVEEASSLEVEVEGVLPRGPEGMPEPPLGPARPGDAEPSGRITAAELFADTGLLPTAEKKESPQESFTYPDLENIIREELGAIETAFYKQLKEKAGAIEKDLAEIVTHFRQKLDEQIDREDPEVRHRLGLVFLEQGLLDEAIEEFRMAASDERLAVDSYALISRCYRQKKNPGEALHWLEEALRLAAKGSHEYYALTYDLATLCEDVDDSAKALALYREVKAWNEFYRDVTKRIKILEKT
jgi:tetratricopeptide (TPR) repeat protein